MTTHIGKQNKAPQWVRAVLALFAFTAAGLASGWLAGYSFRAASFEFDLNIGPVNAPALITVFILSLITTIVAHELGHLVCGRLVGFRFLLFVVGPLKVIREGEGIKVHLNKDVSLYGGLAASAPADDRDLKRRTAVVILGGPLTSLALGALRAWRWPPGPIPTLPLRPHGAR